MILSGFVEDANDGFIYFKDNLNKFHILNIKNILDIEIE